VIRLQVFLPERFQHTDTHLARLRSAQLESSQVSSGSGSNSGQLRLRLRLRLKKKLPPLTLPLIMIPTVIVDRDCECNAQAQVGVWRTWQHADTQARQLLLQPVCHVDVPVPAATPTRTAIERIVVAFVLSLSWHYLIFVFIMMISKQSNKMHQTSFARNDKQRFDRRKARFFFFFLSLFVSFCLLLTHLLAW
jgi:hypothetical protein